MNRPKQLTPSWDLVPQSVSLIAKHWDVFVFLIVLPTLLNVLGVILATGWLSPELVMSINQKQAMGLALIGVSTVLTIINLGPGIHYQLDVSRNESFGLRHYYEVGLRDTPRVFATYIAVVIIIFAGFIAFVVPGFIALRSFVLTPYYVIDKQLSIAKALKLSRSHSLPASGYIWGTLGVQFVAIFSSASLGLIPTVGIVLEQVVALSITFLLVLRYRTIEST